MEMITASFDIGFNHTGFISKQGQWRLPENAFIPTVIFVQGLFYHFDTQIF